MAGRAVVAGGAVWGPAEARRPGVRGGSQRDCPCSLVEELKANNPDFPEVSRGIYVQEVVPNSPSQR